MLKLIIKNKIDLLLVSETKLGDSFYRPNLYLQLHADGRRRHYPVYKKGHTCQRFNLFNLWNLVKEPTYFKNIDKPTCIDHILTNHPK